MDPLLTLSDQIIFRRASGKVVGKSWPEGFLESLKKPSPVTSRVSEEISVTLLDDRALVTLIVVCTKADGFGASGRAAGSWYGGMNKLRKQVNLCPNHHTIT